MQNRWYVDNRDLAKWGVLLKLAEIFGMQRIVQLASYRPNAFGQILIDGQAYDLPAEVLSHFRDLRKICGITLQPQVTVFDSLLEDRVSYLQSALEFLKDFSNERCIVFLDPDTGLEPRKPDFKHVLNEEVKAIWNALKRGDIFVFYQHQTNRAGRPWIEAKRNQLAAALGVNSSAIRAANSPDIANDVVFLFAQRP